VDKPVQKITINELESIHRDLKEKCEGHLLAAYHSGGQLFTGASIDGYDVVYLICQLVEMFKIDPEALYRTCKKYCELKKTGKIVEHYEWLEGGPN